MVTRAGPLPLSPTIATLAVHRPRYACGAPTVRLWSLEVVCSAADQLQRRSSALQQTGCRGGRLPCGRLVVEEVVCFCSRLVVEEVVCPTADWLWRRSSASAADWLWRRSSASATDQLQRRSSALRQTSCGGGRLLLQQTSCGRIVGCGGQRRGDVSLGGIQPAAPLRRRTEEQRGGDTASSYKEEERRREESVEEGVFIDGRRPANRRLGSHNIDINVARLTPTGGSSVLPVPLARLVVRCRLYCHVDQQIPQWGLRRGIRAPLALVRKKKRREEGIEEGVFIDGRRPTSIGDQATIIQPVTLLD